jgi:ABC-type phosphate/phosphonate transport system permease subunit
VNALVWSLIGVVAVGAGYCLGWLTRGIHDR